MFIPRHPVVENQFCQFASQTSVTGGVGTVLAYAGAVCYLVDGAPDAIVNVYGAAAPADAGGQRCPFGFLMQKVKTGYHQVHPAGFFMPGDLGSSDVIAQPSYDSNGAINGSKEAPVGVAHLGVWDTIHYTVDTIGTSALDAGDILYVAAGTADTPSTYGRVGQTSMSNVLDPADKGSGNTNAVVARVVKGATAAQAEANINNTTLYPIRIKLLI